MTFHPDIKEKEEYCLMGNNNLDALNVSYYFDSYMCWYCKDRIKSTLGGLSFLDDRRSIGIAVLKMFACQNELNM